MLSNDVGGVKVGNSLMASALVWNGGKGLSVPQLIDQALLLNTIGYNASISATNSAEAVQEKDNRLITQQNELACTSNTRASICPTGSFQKGRW